MQEKKVQHSSAIKNNEAQLLVYLKSFLLISMIELDHQRSAEHVSGAERWEFPLPAHVGVRSPHSTAKSHTRPLRSFPLPAHLQFHPAPVKSLHACSNLKFLCMPNTCRFQPKPYAWDTLPAWRTWSGFVAWLLRNKFASLLFCRGAEVAVWLDCTWYARIPQAVWLL